MKAKSTIRKFTIIASLLGTASTGIAGTATADTTTVEKQKADNCGRGTMPSKRNPSVCVVNPVYTQAQYNEGVASVDITSDNEAVASAAFADGAASVDTVAVYDEAFRDGSEAALVATGVFSTELSGMDLSGMDLTHANLSGMDLSGADLSGAVLVNANLKGADLTGADLTDVVWTQATCPNGTEVTGLNYDYAESKGWLDDYVWSCEDHLL